MGSRLTEKQKKWLSGVQRALNKSGSEGLGFYTVGDSDICVYNKDYEDEICDHQDSGAIDIGQCIEAVGADFGVAITFPASVHSCAG